MKNEKYNKTADKALTLRELCNALNISRRAIQGYEKHGLVHASGRNERGYLLYNTEMQKKIIEIKQYQKFGFQIKEIQKYLRLPKEKQKEWLLIQKYVLQQKSDEIEKQLILITDLIEQLG